MCPTSSSDPGPGGGPERAGDLGRAAELAANLAAVRARISKACAVAGREPHEVTLIAVTKTYPSSDVRLLRELGLADIGENRDQEAAPKAAACAGLDITWHFIGQLQTRKAGSVATYADVVHSVDRARLARHLGTAARAAGRELTCLVQVSVDGDPSRGGVAPQGVAEVAEAIEAEPGITLGGVMSIAPLEMPAFAAFEVLRDCSDVMRVIRPDADIISAGMSGDLEDAIACGATHVRIGTALLGVRKPPVL